MSDKFDEYMNLIGSIEPFDERHRQFLDKSKESAIRLESEIKKSMEELSAKIASKAPKLDTNDTRLVDINKEIWEGFQEAMSEQSQAISKIVNRWH